MLYYINYRRSWNPQPLTNKLWFILISIEWTLPAAKYETLNSDSKFQFEMVLNTTNNNISFGILEHISIVLECCSFVFIIKKHVHAAPHWRLTHGLIDQIIKISKYLILAITFIKNNN